MPRMDGLEATRRIRALQAAGKLPPAPLIAGEGGPSSSAAAAGGASGGAPAIATPPAVPPRRGFPKIIALTANASSEDRDDCLAAGLNAFIPKPVQPEALRRAILAQVEERFPQGAGQRAAAGGSCGKGLLGGGSSSESSSRPARPGYWRASRESLTPADE